MESGGQVPPAQQWREKLNVGVNMLKRHTSAAAVVMADAAEKAGQKGKSAMVAAKDGWNTKVQPKVGPTIIAFRSGLLATREKVATSNFGMQVSQASREVGVLAREALTKIRTRQGAANTPNNVFGIPLEIVVQRQKGSRPVPNVVLQCAEYLQRNGLQEQGLFKVEGDQENVNKLAKLYDSDANATIPDGTPPHDVASLLKIYLRTLPEPVLTHELYDSLADARSSNPAKLRELLATLPAANQQTLECVTSILLRISQHSFVTKMDARALAVELEPTLIWQKGNGLAGSSGSPSGSLANSPPPGLKASSSFSASEKPATTPTPAATPSPVPVSVPAKEAASTETRGESSGAGDDEEAVSPADIPLDDEPLNDLSAIADAVQIMIEHHDDVFSDVPEEVWQELQK